MLLRASNSVERRDEDEGVNGKRTVICNENRHRVVAKERLFLDSCCRLLSTGGYRWGEGDWSVRVVR